MKKFNNNNVLKNLNQLYTNNLLSATFSQVPVPVNFDADEILNKEFPDGYNQAIRDRLVYVVFEMYRAPARGKEALKWENFINIYHPLKAVVPDCLEYFSILDHHNVIGSTEMYYHGGVKDFGFCFMGEYEAPGFKNENLCDEEFIFKVMQNDFKNLDGINFYPRPFNFLINGNLRIDGQEYLHKLERTMQPEPKTMCGANLSILEVNNRLYKAYELENHKYHFSFNTKTGKLDTTLTRLPEDAREFLTYQSKYLHEVEVKELSILVYSALLDNSLWDLDKEFLIFLKGMANSSNRGTIKAKPGIPLVKQAHSKMSFSNYKLIYGKDSFAPNTGRSRKDESVLTQADFEGKNSIRYKLYNTPLKPTIAKLLLNWFESERSEKVKKEFANFKAVVVRGDLFDQLVDVHRITGVEMIEDFDKLRDSLPEWLFGNGWLTKGGAALLGVFKALYPTVYKLISQIHKLSKGDLPHLVSRIEGQFILNKVCSKINKTKVNLPVFPMPYGIVTTDGNEAYVEKVIREELHKHLNLSCSIQTDLWAPDSNSVGLMRIAS